MTYKTRERRLKRLEDKSRQAALHILWKLYDETEQTAIARYEQKTGKILHFNDEK